MKLKRPVYVIGEGITEKYYFKHLNKLRSYGFKLRPRMAKNSSIDYIEREVERFLSADVTVICVLDADISQKNESDQRKFKEFVDKYKNTKNLILCDSLPSIEFWFLLHFVLTHKSYLHYKQLRDDLRHYISNYDKKEQFLSSETWVQTLIERQTNAIRNAKRTKEKEGSYTNLYKALEYLEKRKRQSF
ncbi:MAG: RloB family protein [Bacteroidota bacterium]